MGLGSRCFGVGGGNSGICFAFAGCALVRGLGILINIIVVVGLRTVGLAPGESSAWLWHAARIIGDMLVDLPGPCLRYVLLWACGGVNCDVAEHAMWSCRSDQGRIRLTLAH